MIENVNVEHAGTSGIYLSSNLQGDATFSFVVVTDAGKEALTNYAPKLKFQLIWETETADGHYPDPDPQQGMSSFH